jgi:uncharacterized membrane protein
MVPMKRNSFFLLGGIIAFIELGLFWLSVELNNPFVIQVAIVAGILAIYLAKRNISDVIEDERTNLISLKASSRTLEVFWIVFLLLSIGSVVVGFNRPFEVRHPDVPMSPPPVEVQSDGFLHFGYFGMMQLILLCLMIFLYVGFRMYYARKYGEWDDDEE